MIEIKDKNNCCGCEACANICPKHCITMVEDEEGFRYPKVDKEKCIDCKLCEKVCQYLNNTKKVTEAGYPLIYACTKKDTDTLKDSTTVAVFYELAKSVVENNGVVVGAIYDENMNVKHVIADNVELLEKMRGSKYVQSELNDIYSKVQQILKTGKLVLFSGTPCQVRGLQLFLDKTYDNLITVDLICHSVPSSKIYRDYIKNTENKYNSKIKDINFRKKINGWLTPYTEIIFENDKIKYLCKSDENEWYKTFISHITTRPSCNNCLYTSIHRVSDLTLGDFWGIDKIRPNIDAYNGVGKIIINTVKGEEIFNNIKDKYNMYTMKIEESMRPNLMHPPEKNPKKDEFYKYYKKNGYKKSYKKFVEENLYKKIKRKVKNIIKGRILDEQKFKNKKFSN